MFYSIFRCTARSRWHQPTQSFLRQYAQASKGARAAPKPTPRSPTPSKLPTTGARTKANMIKTVRIELANKIFDSGQRELYRAPRRLTIFRANSYFLGALLFGTVFGYGFNRLLDPAAARARGLSVWVTGAYWAVTFALCMFGYLVVIRTRGHINAVELVKRGEAVFVQISVRSMLPFRQYQLVVPPYDVLVGRELVLMAETPEYMRDDEAAAAKAGSSSRSVLKAPLRAVSRFFYSILSAGRQFFAQDGILKIAIAHGKSQEKQGYSVDVDGSWYKQEGSSLPAFFELAMMDEEADVD